MISMMPSAVTIPCTSPVPVSSANSSKRKLGFFIDDIVGDDKSEKILKLKDSSVHTPPPAHQSSRSSIPLKANLNLTKSSLSHTTSYNSSNLPLSTKSLTFNSNLSSATNPIPRLLPLGGTATSNHLYLSPNNHHHNHHSSHHNIHSHPSFQKAAFAAAAAAAAASSPSAYFSFNSKFPFDYQTSYHQWLLSRHPPMTLQAGFPGSPISPFMLANRKVKRIRTAFNPQQLIELENAFAKNHYVVGGERKQLADSLNLSETQVKVWFQNRRTKHKRQKQENENGTGEDGLNKADSEINYRERRLSRDSEDADIEDEMDTEEEKEEELERSRKRDARREDKSLYIVQSNILNTARPLTTFSDS